MKRDETKICLLYSSVGRVGASKRMMMRYVQNPVVTFTIKKRLYTKLSFDRKAAHNVG